MPASASPLVQYVSDDHLYTIGELYEKFGEHIPAYQWYIVHTDLQYMGHSELLKQHIYTICAMRPTSRMSGIFNVKLTIMDWAISPHKSIERIVLFNAATPVLIDVSNPPKYKVFSAITTRDI